MTMLKAILSAFTRPGVPAPTYQWPDVADEDARLKLLDLARMFLHVREIKGQQNRGARVEGIQRWSGGKPGDSWCAHVLTMILDLFYGGKAPFPREGSCDVMLALAKDGANGLEIVSAADMRPGDVFFRLAPGNPTDARHVGLTATSIRRRDNKAVFGQLSGNTSKDGLSDNGDGFYEREIEYKGPDHIVFVRLPRRPSTTE